MSGYEERRPAVPGRDSHERHEPDVWHEPTDRSTPHEDDHEQHAGNATVNHRPDDQGRQEARPEHAAPDAPAADRFARGTGEFEGPTDGSGAGPDGLETGFGPDELALQRMLHQAVDDIEPRDGTLEHLRRAVPARRARKRQALVGMAAAALFIGTAIPALVHVSNATGPDADPSIAGQASQAQQGTGRGKGPDGGSSGSVGSGGTTKGTDQGGQKDKGDKGKGAPGGATGGANPTASAASAPECTGAQLGGATATTGAPDSTGTVYGTFHVTNVSTTTCTVSGGGSVSTTAQGAADASKISVADHVTGDAATGLPEPSQQAASLVLKPGAAYEVKFAWVPSETCPTTGGGTGGPSPDPSPSDSTGTSGGTSSEGSGGGVAPQLMTEDGVADGSVVVSHTPETGSGTSTTTVPNACAGTVYRTGILPAS
ncbi:hypothetical protein [Streptomyces sp. NPDC052036]|uniref:hypothetical protein n=1 Tax=Streptomyces sp. NPDC052036 TaxID=3155171 RepID=UPI00343359D6